MFTIVDQGHEHPGDHEGESGEEEEGAPETEFLGVKVRERLGNQLVQIAWISSVLGCRLSHCCLEMFPVALEDEPAGRLRDEDDNDHAGTTDAGDAHYEVVIRPGINAQNVTNEAG